jgi:hypothetical protein
MHLSALLLVFSLLLTRSLAGRIGRFTFIQRELLQEGETLEDKANQTELLERAERGFIARLDYSNNSLLQTHAPAESASKVSALLAQFPSNNATHPLNGSFYLQLRVKQKEERFLNDTSDYFLGGTSEADMQKHVTAADCVDSAVYGEALEFEISPYATRDSSFNRIETLNTECIDHTYKKANYWQQNSHGGWGSNEIATETTTEENCFDNNAFAQEHYRYAQASFTPAPTQVVLENVTESSCSSRADERIVSFVPYNESITFQEEFVREEECSDSADALSPLYAYNTENRWDTDRRSDAASENATVVALTSQLPYYTNGKVVSAGNVEPLYSNPLQGLSRYYNMEKQWPSREPAFTLMAWVKGHGTLLSILSGTSVCGKQVVFSVDAMGKPSLDFACMDQHDSRLHTVTSEWRHVAFTYDGHGTRTIVVDGEEEVDVYHNTSRDYFKETNKVLVNPHTHNTVIVLTDDFGNPMGRFAGFSERDCLGASLAMNHPYFALEEGVCNSSATVSTGTAEVFHRSVQYRIQEDDFLRMELGPFVGQVDELLFYGERLPNETIHQLGLTQNTGTRFNASSLIAHPVFGLGASKKVSWEQYPTFYEEQVGRTECRASGDHRYETAIGHHAYVHSAEGRGGSSVISYEAYSKGLENITHLAGDHCQDDLLLDSSVVLHSYQNNTSMNECRAQRTKDGACLLNGEAVESSEADCTGVFLPFTNYTWLPDPYTIEYDTKESDCPQSSEYWGYSEPLLLGAQGRNTQVYNDHERDFYYLNKVGGPQQTLNTSSLASVQEWCRATISCAGIQQDKDHYYPVEEITGPSEDYGYRLCLDEKAHRIGALQCFVEAAKELQGGVLYIHGDEFRLHPWGYSGSANGTSCTKSNTSFFWGDGTYGDEVCSDKAQDYYALPIVQTRWQRDNDTVLSTKEKDCVAQRLQWLPHAREYDTIGTGSRPHFLVSGQKAWQREPVDCLYASNATFAINKTTVRECRDEAIFFGAIGYSFQRVGAEFMHMTARHYTHPVEARAECQRLQAHSEGPENAWDLCTNDEWDCAADDSCITSNTPDNTIFAIAACCFNTGTSCAITTNTSVCTPKRGYESFFFDQCADEEIENTTNTTYNVYDPVWARSEWRAETRSRTYDAAYYDIVQESGRCGHGMHLSYDECLAVHSDGIELILHASDQQCSQGTRALGLFVAFSDTSVYISEITDGEKGTTPPPYLLSTGEAGYCSRGYGQFTWSKVSSSTDPEYCASLCHSRRTNDQIYNHFKVLTASGNGNGCYCGGTYASRECGNQGYDGCSSSSCNVARTSGTFHNDGSSITYEMLYPYTIITLDSAAGYCSDSYTAGEYMTHIRGSKEQCASWCYRNLDTNPWALHFIHKSEDCYCGHTKPKDECTSWTTSTSYHSYSIEPQCTTYPCAHDSLLCCVPDEACEAFATGISLSYSVTDNTATPQGCYVDASSPAETVVFNSNTNTVPCSSTHRCLKFDDTKVESTPETYRDWCEDACLAYMSFSVDTTSARCRCSERIDLCSLENSTGVSLYRHPWLSKTTLSAVPLWLGEEVYDKDKIAGCAVDASAAFVDHSERIWLKTTLGDTHILGVGYHQYPEADATTVEECLTLCETNGYSFASFATNSVACRCGYVGTDHEPHAYPHGTGVYELRNRTHSMYYNRYLYDSAKLPNASDVALCKNAFEHFTETFDYGNTKCRYLNHELEISSSSQTACQDYGSAHGFKAISYSDKRCLLARARGPCEAKALWSSSFFVEAEVEGQFTRNTNLETSVMSISECLLNQTALFDFKQIPYGREEHGLQYSPEGQSHADLETAKLACDSQTNCTVVYATPAGDFYALGEAMAQELLPTHAQYTLHKHWVKNTNNYANRTHARHFHASSKEACHEACLADAKCMQVVFTEGYCFFYDDVYEASDSGALDSHTLHLELKGAVAYKDTGDCWLYRNSIGRGKCTDFTNASNYSVYPLDESLTGENKVVYVREEADTLQASAYQTIVTEERTEEWCQNREGSSAWQKYADVVYKSTTEECTEGTWVKDADLTRSMVLQRECELLDSHAAFTRNPDVVTETSNGGLSYQKQYENGYKKLLAQGCGSEGEGIEYEYESGTLYGQDCYTEVATNGTCQSKDKGYGYAVYEGLCLVYDYPIGSNASDCRYAHANNQSSGTSGTYRPLSHLNLAEAIDACNAKTECVGVCEAAAYYISRDSGTEASYQCHKGWSGDSCATVEAKPYTDERITDKRHTAIAYCQMLGQELCKAEHVPLGYDCVHYKEQSNCTVVDHTDIHPVAFCCGKEVYYGKAQKQAVFYNRTTALGTCQEAPIERLGSAVFDHRPKLLDSYSVEKVATSLCHGGSQANTEDCEQACLNSSSCLFFTNRSTETDCWLHTECTSPIAFADNFSTYRLRRKQGVYDAPQAQHAMLGDCQYHYGVQALVEEDLPYAEATQTRQRWRCERASVSMLRNLTYSIHSFNESFQFDIMEEHTVYDERRIHEHLQAVNYNSTSADSLEACLAQANDQVVSFKEVTKECLLFMDSWEAIKTVSQYTGASRESYGLYEGPFHTTLYEATPIVSYTPSATVSSWLESTAKDDCELLCEANELCEAYALAGQECQLHAMPNQTMVDYLRAVEGTGSILLFLRSSGEYVCRRGAVAWDIVLVPSAVQHPIGNTEALSTSTSLGACKQTFLNDERVPRLDTVLYNASTGECRISLLRNRLLEASNISANGFSHYTVSKQNPYRTEATKYETEDMARDTCMTYDSLLVGRDSTSWASAVFWEREKDVIRHEILEEHCGVALPPQLPLLSYAWDQNQQGSLAFNIKEAECKQSDQFLSWRTNIAGQKKIEVQNETECLAYSTNETSALYLGNEPIEGADYRSSCNGIVAEHNFERLFTEPLRMLASEDKRITVSEPSIDACAATALEYYSHFNRSASSKVFEYHFTKTGQNCAYFESEECLGLCLVEDSPSAARVGFSSFRLDGSLGISAAACWLLSVMDSTEGNAYCRKCPIGKHNSRAASNCLPCQQGRYSDEEGLKACKSCKEGTFQFGSGETHCNMCAAGQYQDEMGERGCKICAAGKYEEAGVCKDCPVGKAGPSNFLENKAGELQYTGSSYKGALVYFDPRYDYSGVHGISYKDEQGVYMKGYSPIFTSLRSRQATLHDSSADCLSCEAGQYGDEQGLEECKACAHGTYTDQNGQSLCQSCDKGLVARADANDFHAFMPYACSSAEMLGEYRAGTSPYAKTMEDTGLLLQQTHGQLEACLEACALASDCHFASYKESNGNCRLFRKCDEVGATGWKSYRRSVASTSASTSTSYALSMEATLYGPTHHECAEEALLVAPETYTHRLDQRISSAGTIGIALGFQSAIDSCNSMPECVGFTYAGVPDATLRTFTEDEPIYLKSQGQTNGQNGVQAYFKEEPVDSLLDCQIQCANLPSCHHMHWNGTKVCRKWGSTCTPTKKKESFLVSAAESSMYKIRLSASFALFPFQGTWATCDAVVHSNFTLPQCEQESVAKTSPMFYFDAGQCHVYTSFSSAGLERLFSHSATSGSSVCLQGGSPAEFKSDMAGELRVVGAREWDKGAKTCQNCPAGLYTGVAEAVRCRQCAVGQYDANPQSEKPLCQACEIGRFQDEPGQATCKACSPGRYQDELAQGRCKASGQGFRTTGEILEVLRPRTSGPLQNNSYEDYLNPLGDQQGRTGKEICGRNSFANGYENVRCQNVPVGAISVTRARSWTKEAQACFYEKTALEYNNVSTDLPFYDNDLFNRRGIGSLDECLDFANEHSNTVLAFVEAVSFGEGLCHFFSDTSEGVRPKCILDDEHQSAYLSVGTNEYASEAEEPSVPPDWFRSFTPHDSVRFVSPYKCQGLHYEDMGDYYSASDCVQLCRMQEAFGEKKCRYISYMDNRCYLVNWMPKDTNGDFQNSGKIYDGVRASGRPPPVDGTANIEIPCSYGSRVVPVPEATGIGKGGYKVEEFVPNAVDLSFRQGTISDAKLGSIMAIGPRLDKFGLPSRGNGGTADTFSFPESTTTFTFSVSSTYAVSPSTSSFTINFDNPRPIKTITVTGGFMVSLTDIPVTGGYKAVPVYIVPQEMTCAHQTWKWDSDGKNIEGGHGTEDFNIKNDISASECKCGGTDVPLDADMLSFGSTGCTGPEIDTCKANGATVQGQEGHDFINTFWSAYEAQILVHNKAIVAPKTLHFDETVWTHQLQCEVVYQTIEWSTTGIPYTCTTRAGSDQNGVWCQGSTSKKNLGRVHTAGSTYPSPMPAPPSTTPDETLKTGQDQELYNLLEKLVSFGTWDPYKPIVNAGYGCCWGYNWDYYSYPRWRTTKKFSLELLVPYEAPRQGDSEWAIAECDTAGMVRTGFEANCRYTRRRYYDRLKAALLQQNTIPANVFPDYKINGGYQGDNKLELLGFYNIDDKNDLTPPTSGFHFEYRQKNHIKYEHSTIRPLYDVSINEDDFEASSTVPVRAAKGANAFTYCTGSTTMLKEMNSPRSCEEVGYPFVPIPMSGSSGAAKVCTKVKETSGAYALDTIPTHCCIGQSCVSQFPSMPSCANYTAGSGLESVPYAASEFKVVGDVLVEHTDTDSATGLAFVKDRCNQLGEICLAVSVGSDFFFYAHGQDATIGFSSGAEAIFKYANMEEEGKKRLASGKEVVDSTIHDCYIECLRTKFCEYFHFTPSKVCLLQNTLTISISTATDAVTFKIRSNKDDETRSQFCTACPNGRTASTSSIGGVGMCAKCEPGRISSDDSLFVSEAHIGQAGQEQCQACPEGMVYLEATEACVACPKGFICPTKESLFESGAEQCPSNHFSTSSLLEFLGDDVSTEASLRCETCSNGKYAVERGAEHCEKCPKGFFSQYGLCQPCAVGEYTLFTGSEECYEVDQESFIAWPASTLADKESCNTEDCSGEDFRTCSADGDAYCQKCPTIRAGHYTWYDGTECRVDPCGEGKYSPNGCLGEDCCLTCVSSCVAGQHSVGCGDPADASTVAHTKNTECAPCAEDSFTEFDAGASCDGDTFKMKDGVGSDCEIGTGSPHRAGSFTSANPFRRLAKKGPIYWPTVYDHRGPSAAVLNDASCCSAAAYQCVPCRTNKVTYSSNYEGKYFGRSNQPAWSTNGLTGQTYCRSYWDVWAYQAYGDMTIYDDEKGATGGGGT